MGTTDMSRHERGLPGLSVQSLTWVDARPRFYGETTDAWRTSCPRLSIWEDAVSDGFVALDAGPAGQQREARVVLTEAGRAHLDHYGELGRERILVC